MRFALWRKSFVLIGMALALSAQIAQAEDGDFPAWLGGKPDLVMQDARCGVYEWLLDEADRQTEGVASKDELASMRVINMANKLVDHHLSSPADSYGADVKFLVVGGDRGPFHFKFHVSHAELERMLKMRCGE